MQNGLRLVRVYQTAPRPGGSLAPLARVPFVGSAFEEPAPPAAPGMRLSFSSDERLDLLQHGSLTATGRSSTGAVYSLECRLAATASATRYFVDIEFPRGFPTTYEWLDVTFPDTAVSQARWRLRQFPKARHALPPPVAVTQRASVGGCTVEGDAWYTPRGNGVTFVELRTVGAAKGKNLRLRVNGITREWDEVPPDFRVGEPYRYGMVLDKPDGRVFHYTLHRSPYAAEERYIRIKGEITSSNASRGQGGSFALTLPVDRRLRVAAPYGPP